jgi:hypothetical protein
LKNSDGNKEDRPEGKKMKRNNIQAIPQWIIKSKKITPKNFGYTLKCFKCGKKLNLEDAFCCFEPNRKVKNGRYSGSLFSVFLCGDCAKTHEPKRDWLKKLLAA